MIYGAHLHRNKEYLDIVNQNLSSTDIPNFSDIIIDNINLSDPSHTLYVDCAKTGSYTEKGTIHHPFKTIQSAINQVITNGDNSWTVPYIIKIAAGKYVENVVCENSALYNLIFEGDGFRQVIIEPSSGLAFSSTSNNDNLSWLLFRNIHFAKGTSFEGASSNQWFGYNMFFEDCYWNSGTALFKNLSYPIFWGNNKFSNSTLKFSNCTQVTMIPYVELGSALSNFTIETDQTGGVKTPKDWTNGTKLLMIGDSSSEDPVWSLVNITTWTGTALQIRSTRFGVSGHTIPANATLIAYNSVLVGNYTNNGTLSLYGSFVTGSLTNNATLNLYQNDSLIKNNSGITGTTVKDALVTIWNKIGTDLDLSSTEAVYFGVSNVDGTWRIIRDGDNLIFQRRETGNYITKSTISA